MKKTSIFVSLNGLALVFGLALAACSPSADTAPVASQRDLPARHPESGLDLRRLTVGTGASTHAFTVEMARTPSEQAKGLMFRSSLAPDEGMLFPRNPPDIASFWMKNTVIPLDIIYVAPNHRIETIAANAEPYSLEPISSSGPVIAVLELAGGRTAELGIKKGDKVNWTD